MKNNSLIFFTQIDMMLFFIFIVIIMISALLSSVKIESFNVKEDNKNYIVVELKNNELVKVEKPFYLKVRNNYILAIKRNDNRLTCVPYFLNNHKEKLNILILTSVNLLGISIFITFFLLFRNVNKRRYE